MDILPRDDFEERCLNGEYDICIMPVSSPVNSAESFLERLYEVSGTAGADRLLLLSTMKDVNDKSEFILNTEAVLYRDAAAMPLCFESRKTVYKNVYDYYYDPFQYSYYFKYMKEK